MRHLLFIPFTLQTNDSNRYYSKDEKHGLRKMLQESQAVLAGFFIADYVPALGWLDSLTGMRGRLDKNFHVLDCFYEKVIEEHKGKAGEREGGEDTMDALLRIQGEGSASLTEEHMKALLMVLPRRKSSSIPSHLVPSCLE